MNEQTKEIALPEPVARREVTEAQWKTLCNNLYPGADPQSVLMVVDYCRARKLDPLKKPCHIVPMRVKDARLNEYVWRDVVMPGIYEYRMTAHRTEEYLGHSKPEYGAPIEQFGIAAPEWCELTVYRWNPHAKVKTEYPVRVYFSEVCATTGAGTANARWSRAPFQMLTKCTEAAALREAFPDEFGGEPTFEEMADQQPINEVAQEVHQVREPYPVERFENNLAKWGALIESGTKTADDIITMIESRASLTDAMKEDIHSFEKTETQNEN